MLEEVEADHGRYLARSVSAVESVRLTEVRLTADQWQEVGKEIKQPHNKLRRLSLTDISFNNTEFAMFCRCLDDVPEIHVSDLNLTRSQWGIIAKRLSNTEIKTERLVLDNEKQDKEAILILSSLDGFKLIEKGRATVIERE